MEEWLKLCTQSMKGSENIVGKGENAGKPAFFPFTLMLPKADFLVVEKIVDCFAKGLLVSMHSNTDKTMVFFLSFFLCHHVRF